MLKSMTAFARNEANGEWGSAIWEIRTVNHRYLDMGFKLPDELRPLECDLRKVVVDGLSRGKVDCILRFKPGGALGRHVEVDDALVDALLLAEKVLLEKTAKQSSLALSELLQWPGVVTVSEENLQLAFEAIISLFKSTLEKLVAMREREGHELKRLLLAKLNDIRHELDGARHRYAESKDNSRERLMARFQQLGVTADASRLEQELVLILQRLDVTEEFDRLATHVEEVDKILTNGGVVGRRLDFLMQELNREANTLASKSQDAKLSQKAVELKVLIEQIREQVQNIE